MSYFYHYDDVVYQSSLYVCITQTSLLEQQGKKVIMFIDEGNYFKLIYDGGFDRVRIIYEEMGCMSAFPQKLSSQILCTSLTRKEEIDRFEYSDKGVLTMYVKNSKINLDNGWI